MFHARLDSKEHNDLYSDKPLQENQQLENTMTLHLNKEAFYDDEQVIGHVLINIQDTYYPRRLMLSIFGEFMSHTIAKKDRSTFKKMTTIMTNGGAEPAIGRTFTAKKMDQFEDEFQGRSMGKRTTTRTMTRTMTRTRTFTRTMTAATGKSGVHSESKGKIVPVEEIKNRELFCHYNIPVFTFKTEQLPVGVYKVPFKFLLSSAVLPSFNYNRENFQFHISYTMVAELEENTESEKNNSPTIGDNGLKCKKDLKIFKSSTRRTENSPTTRLANNEVIGKLKLTGLFCTQRNENKVKLAIEKNFFRLGDQLKFEIVSYDRSLQKGQSKITSNLIEELSNEGLAISSFKTVLEVLDLQFEQEEDKTVSKKTVIRGTVNLGGASREGFRPSNENINHIFEVILGYKKNLIRSYISLQIPITLRPQKLHDLEVSTPLIIPGATKANQKEEEEEEEEEDDDDNMITLPLAKFKLEERYNLLDKTAQILEERF